jgi:hypothetical protein
MGLISKLVGGDKMHEVLERVVADLEQQHSSGMLDAVSSVAQGDVGTRFRLDSFASWLCSTLEERGYRIVNCTEPGWNYRFTVTARRQ